MKHTQKRHQSGHLRKVARKKGFAWECTFSIVEHGKRVRKFVTLSGAEYPTEREAQLKLQPLLRKVNEGTVANVLEPVYFGSLLDRFIEEELPPKKSSQQSYLSLIKVHIRPKWGAMLIEKMKPADIKRWINELPLAPLSKGHIRSLMHKLFDLAQLWEYVEVGRNPIQLVQVRGVTKREKDVVVLDIAVAARIIRRLPYFMQVMMYTLTFLGLRQCEMLALKWSDFDWENRTVLIQRRWWRGDIDEVKTPASKALLPVAEPLVKVLEQWKKYHEEKQFNSEWVFPSFGRWRTSKKARRNKTGLYLGTTLQQNHLRPKAEAEGVHGVGFHTFRHSYKTWLDSLSTPMGVMKDLMRHSNISVTMNVYGNTLAPEKRTYNDKLVQLFLGADANNPAPPPTS